MKAVDLPTLCRLLPTKRQEMVGLFPNKAFLDGGDTFMFRLIDVDGRVGRLSWIRAHFTFKIDSLLLYYLHCGDSHHVKHQNTSTRDHTIPMF
jgi:hypothetical protein